MSQSASQAWAFYREVAKTRIVWTLREDEGHPTSNNAMPFWSSRSRVEQIIKTIPAYSMFHPVEITWEDFCDKWLTGLTCDGILVGLNWSGDTAVGYELEPERVKQSVEAIIEDQQAP